MTPLMQRIIAVTHPELAERLSADRQQTSALTEDTQPQTVESSRGNESGSDFAHTQTDTEEASAGEGDRTVPEDSHVETPSSSSSDTLGEPALLSQTGSGHSPPSVVRQHTGPTLPPTAPCTVRGRRSRGSRVAFGAGTAAPATVSQNALCAEAVDLLRQLCVGQTNMTNAFQDHDRKLGQVVAFMEGMHGDLAGLHRTVQSLASSVSSAIVQSNEQGATCVSPSTPLDVSGGSDYSEQDSNTAYCTRSSVRQHVRARRAQTPSPRSAKSVHVDDVRCTGVHTQDPQVLLGDMPSGATQPFNTKGTPKARDSHMSMDCSLDKASQKTKAPTKSRETPKSRPTAEETHLDDIESSKLSRDWVGKVFNSSVSKPDPTNPNSIRKCGVAILFRKSLSFTISKTWSDPEGRMVWAAAKATIRGQLMRDAALSKKKNAAKQVDLEKDIRRLSQLYISKPTLQNRKLLEQARMSLNTLFTSKAKYALQKMKGRHYEQGEKAGRLLAAQLRQREAAMAIPAIKSSGGDILTRPQYIVEEFASFYRSLYSPSTHVDTLAMSTFLDAVHLPQLSDDGRALLEGAITKEEISSAITALPYHKAPGDDGFPPEFFKWTGQSMIDTLHAAFEEAVEESSLGSISNKAIIAVLPKPGKDPLFVNVPILDHFGFL
ncbi:uncharacterized protein LOC144798014 [Lissotriton helveticus]